MKYIHMLLVATLLTLGFARTAHLETITEKLAGQLEKSAADELVRVNIAMVHEADWGSLVSQATKMSREQRRAFAVEYLKDLAAESQKEVLGFLREKGNGNQVDDIRSIWSANVVSCSATPQVIREVAGLPSVRSVDWDEWKYMLPEEPQENPVEAFQAVKGIVPNLTLVGAPDVWALGFTGEGVLISIHDTGVNYG